MRSKSRIHKPQKQPQSFPLSLQPGFPTQKGNPTNNLNLIVQRTLDCESCPTSIGGSTGSTKVSGFDTEGRTDF